MPKSDMLQGLPVTATILIAVLAGCAGRPVSAPVVDRTASGTPPPSSAPAARPTPPAASFATANVPASYVVRRGDTLHSIALEHGLDYRDIATWNRIEDPSRIRVGQVLRLENPDGRSATVDDRRGASSDDRPTAQVGAARASNAPEARPVESAQRAAGASVASGVDPTLKREPLALRLPYSAENLALLSRNEGAASSVARAAAEPAAAPRAAQPSPTAAAGADTRPASEAAIDFVWPARGRVVAEFAEPRMKGIDIAGVPGEAVIAAAAGRVTYTGSGIPGMGKLIVIRHDNNYLTVYAHNREILVKEQQTVVRGQRIAELGSTDADSPKLHFQIRRGAQPLDPRKFLPADRG